MSDPDTQSAIDAALKNDWQKALDLNLKLLKNTPSDIDCLNRLGKACLELGNTRKAIGIFKEILKLNKYDPIATKNLLRATESPASKGAKIKTPATNFVSFLEEPGKTKMVSLVNVASTKTLLTVRCADFVNLTIKRHSIFVESQDGNYLGSLPDDLGHRILVLVKGGNTYEAFVKSVTKGALIVFIREKTRSKRFKNTPSFPTGSSDYLSFVREDQRTEETVPKEGTEENQEDEDEATFKRSERLHQDELPEET